MQGWGDDSEHNLEDEITWRKHAERMEDDARFKRAAEEAKSREGMRSASRREVFQRSASRITSKATRLRSLRCWSASGYPGYNKSEDGSWGQFREQQFKLATTPVENYRRPWSAPAAHASIMSSEASRRTPHPPKEPQLKEEARRRARRVTSDMPRRALVRVDGTDAPQVCLRPHKTLSVRPQSASWACTKTHAIGGGPLGHTRHVLDTLQEEAVREQPRDLQSFHRQTTRNYVQNLRLSRTVRVDSWGNVIGQRRNYRTVATTAR